MSFRLFVKNRFFRFLFSTTAAGVSISFVAYSCKLTSAWQQPRQPKDEPAKPLDSTELGALQNKIKSSNNQKKPYTYILPDEGWHRLLGSDKPKQSVILAICWGEIVVWDTDDTVTIYTEHNPAHWASKGCRERAEKGAQKVNKRENGGNCKLVPGKKSEFWDWTKCENEKGEEQCHHQWRGKLKKGAGAPHRGIQPHEVKPYLNTIQYFVLSEGQTCDLGVNQATLDCLKEKKVFYAETERCPKTYNDWVLEGKAVLALIHSTC